MESTKLVVSLVKSDPKPPLLTANRRVDVAHIGLIFLYEFVSNSDPEDALDLIVETITEEEIPAGNA